MSCEAYEKELAAQDSKSLTMVASTTKPCPHCGVRIDRAEGCDHVICSACHKDFCFRCLEPNLTGKYIRTCPNCTESYGACMVGAEVASMLASMLAYILI